MDVHKEVLEGIRKFQMLYRSMKGDNKLVINEFRPRFVETDHKSRLKARFPFISKFTNGMGLFQGGVLCALLDEVYGPLVYMAAGKPAVTLELSCSYMRPFVEGDEYIEIEAHIISKTRKVIVMHAEVRNPEGKLLATSSTHFMILNEIPFKSEQRTSAEPCRTVNK